MGIHTNTPFSIIVSQFIEQYCEAEPIRKVRDTTLFTKFREYWKSTVGEEKYPALLGQFRVEMTLQGYQSSDGKWPQWYGIRLRQKKAKASSATKPKTSKKVMSAKRSKKVTNAKTKKEIPRSVEPSEKTALTTANHQLPTPGAMLTTEYALL